MRGPQPGTLPQQDGLEGREGTVTAFCWGTITFCPPMTSLTNPHGELSECSDVTGDWEGPLLPPSPRAALAQRVLFLRQQFLLKLHVQVLQLMWLLPPFSTDAPSSLGTDSHSGRRASGQFRKRFSGHLCPHLCLPSGLRS